MTTEYELSTHLVVWGDDLDALGLASSLGLDQSSISTVRKGDSVPGIGDARGPGKEKTGRLIVQIDAMLQNSRRLPELQLDSVAGILRRSKMPISHAHGARRAELQLFFYYKDKAEGEVDFNIPAEVMEEIVRNRISVSISIMP